MNSSLLVKVRLSPRLMVTSAGWKRRPFWTMVWASAKAADGSQNEQQAQKQIFHRVTT